MRHTKIVATVGPSSRDERSLEALVAAGVDVLRLNFAHGSRPEHAEVLERIRRVAERSGRPIAVLGDLGGPKIRTGPLEGGRPIVLRAGERITISVGNFPGSPGRISTPSAELAREVKPGGVLLLDDGRIELRVEQSDGAEIRATVVVGGELGEHKGINAPGVRLAEAALSPKDVEDLRFAATRGVDFVALSFVRSAADLRAARRVLAEAGAEATPLVAKIERPEAVERAEEILAACDAVMIARGDLGLELPLERVPRIQKEFTRRARARGLPTIVATQVLESMRTEARPTRAEVSDAANAVDDGVDAILLSGETAVGRDPQRVVRTLDAIVREAEALGRDTPWVRPPLELPLDARSTHPAALCEAAVTLAVFARARAIVALTREGRTARLLSALRPPVPIFAVTGDAVVARRLALHRGVRAVRVDFDLESDPWALEAGRRLLATGALEPDDLAVFVRIHADLTRTDANFLAIRRLGEVSPTGS